MKISVGAAAAITLIASQAAYAQGAVQWRVQDGGNGHWYQLAIPAAKVTATEAATAAVERGGSLASISSASENQFVFALASANPSLWTPAWPGATQLAGPWIGGNYANGRWQWSDGTAWGYANWAPGEPNYLPDESAVSYMGWTGGSPTSMWNNSYPYIPIWGYVIEWSADCNSDGIVDYGQIIAGQIADSNQDGIPDVCQCGSVPNLPACCIGDILIDGIVNGADLGALLSYWGPVTSSSVSRACDLNADGLVDGSDLGMLLANWGACH